VLEAQSRQLSPAEQARTASFRFERDRARHVFRRGMLRHVLGFHLGLEPGQLAFDSGSFGKPGLVADAGCGARFNLSHSGDMVAIAVRRGGEVGIDVEVVRTIDEMEAIARDYFAAAERQHLARTQDDRDRAFLRLWTRKEAYVKAVGSGLSLSLTSFAAHEPTVVADDGVAWSLCDLALPSGYVGALAVQGPAVAVDYRAWTPCA
jgi:4'-phosphopantetheinyl transferase